MQSVELTIAELEQLERAPLKPRKKSVKKVSAKPRDELGRFAKRK